MTATQDRLGECFLGLPGFEDTEFGLESWKQGRKYSSFRGSPVCFGKQHKHCCPLKDFQFMKLSLILSPVPPSLSVDREPAASRSAGTCSNGGKSPPSCSEGILEMETGSVDPWCRGLRVCATQTSRVETLTRSAVVLGGGASGR